MNNQEWVRSFLKFRIEAFMKTRRFKSHSQKSATFRFDKNNGPKTGKKIFSLLNLSQKYRKMLDCSTRHSLNFLKFESLKIA